MVKYITRSLIASLVLATGALHESHAQRVAPVASGNSFIITTGLTSVNVGPSRGARIRSLKYDGTELLYQDSSGSPSSHGSSFWTSPQAHWTQNCRNANNNGCWQPPTAYDGSGAASIYTGGLLTDSSVTYTGTADSYTGARLRKTIWGNANDTSITIRYHIVNTSSTKKAHAGWEVTRMTTGGLTFYAKSLEDTIQGNGTSGTALIAMIKDTLGVKWHKYDSTVSLSGGTPKFWDGTSEGWFAHVDKSRLLYIKKFQDIPASKKAPVNENQIEYYTNNNTRSLIEMELQSAYDSVAAGDSIVWDVKWYVRRLPDSIPVTANAALLAFTRATVNGPTTSLRSGQNPGAMGTLKLALSGDRVTFALPTPGSITVELQDTRGRVIQTLHSGHLSRGNHAFRIAPTAKGVHWLVMRGDRDQILSVRKIPRL